MKFTKLLPFLILSLLISLFYKCSYNFSEDYYVDIKVPTANDGKIILLNLNNNETVNERKVINYKFEGNPNQIGLETKIYLDNETLSSNSGTNEGNFMLFPDKYEDGEHIITIIHTYTSGSGSLKDRLSQKETITKEEKFIFNVKRNPSTPPSITNVTIENGSILVEWDNIEGTDFSNAYLSLRFKYKEIKIPLDNSMLSSKKYIDKKTVLFEGSTNSWKFDAYSNVTYAILFTNEYEELYGNSKSLSYNSDWLDFKISYINNNSYKIVWGTYPLYNNFEYFEVFTFDNLKASSSGGEYLINEPYVLGKEYPLSVRPKSEEDIQYYRFNELALDENTFNLFDHNHLYSLDFKYNPSTQTYFVLIAEDRTGTNIHYYIYEYSNTMQFIRKKSILVSHHLNKLSLNPINNNLHIDAPSGSYEIDKTSLELVNSYTNGNDTQWVHTLREGILFSWKTSDRLIKITNLKTNTVIFEGPIEFKPFVFSSYGGTLSDDGKYIFIPNYATDIGTVYKITNDTLVKVFEKTNSSILFYSNKAFYGENNDVYLLDLETNSTSSLNVGRWSGIQLDPISQKVLLQANDQLGVYNLANKTLKKFVAEVNKNSKPPFVNEDRDYRIFLQNNKLIHTKGIYLGNY